MNALQSLTYPLDVYKLGNVDHVTLDDWEMAGTDPEKVVNLNALAEAEWHVNTVRHLVNGMLQSVEASEDPYVVIGKSIPEEAALKERFHIAVHDALDFLENIHQIDWPEFGFVLPEAAFA